MLKVLPADTGENLEQVKILFREYVDSLGFDLAFQGFQEELANLPSDYSGPAGYLLVVKYKDQPAGCVALRAFNGKICEMKRLYVRPQFRGLGVGRALAEAIIEKARRIGYARMRLDTAPSMEAARALYASLGFREISPYRYNPIEGAVFMELEIVSQ